MTKQLNLLGRYVSPQEYILVKQDDFLRQLDSAFKAELIDELNYKRLLLETCDKKDPEEIYEFFINLFDDFQYCLINAEIFKIEARIVKGAEMIEKENDPIKKRQYMQLYESLLKELESLKEGRHEQKTAV